MPLPMGKERTNEPQCWNLWLLLLYTAWIGLIYPDQCHGLLKVLGYLYFHFERYVRYKRHLDLIE